MNPETALLRASAHWGSCAVCILAGGEFAKPAFMCPIGRYLVEDLERAETEHTGYQDIKDISVRGWVTIILWGAVGLAFVWTMHVAANAVWGGQ